MKSAALLGQLTGAVDVAVLAHQGGWDEILLVVGPLAVVAGLLWLANKRVSRQLEAAQAEAQPEEPPEPEPQPQPDGEARTEGEAPGGPGESPIR